MEVIAAITVLGLAAVLVYVTAVRKRAESNAEGPRFCAKGRLLSASEKSFAEKLELALNGRYRVLPKVSLACVIEPGEHLDSRSRSELSRRLQETCLDLVLTDVASWEVLAAIALEGRRGRISVAGPGPAFAESALRSANIHLLRFPGESDCSAAYLAAQIESILAQDFIETLTFSSLQEGETKASERELRKL